MITLASRCRRNIAIIVLAAILGGLVYTIYSLSLRHTSFISGWTLFLIMLALALYNARKKLPFMPWANSSTWLQFHIYAGFFTFVLFLFHVKFRVPNGTLEATLAFLYLGVFGSGIVGLLISRSIPRRLTTRGEEIIFERIPVFQRRLREALEQLVSRALKETRSLPIAELYAKRLLPFFAGPRHFWWHLVQSNRPRYALLNELEAFNRYMTPEEQEIAAQIAALITTKDDLDYHYVHQAVLKYWLFIHIPLTYSLLLFSLLHGVMVYAFIGRI
ncbi:MAG: hypothetical protein O7E52_03705 [Candidatus Poribacteria bacterium]|nr:hypothetical protein [Candidatus Poribacteria bacterium]